MNVLILSAGTRNKIVQYFRNALSGLGTVIATDMSPLAPALYEADKHFIVPRMTDPNYLDVIIGICKSEHVDGVLSLIDPELSLLAEHDQEFASIGTRVIGSSFELCELSLDKMAMYRWLSTHNYRCAKSWDSLEEFETAYSAGEVDLPVFVKPVRGSASIAISKVADPETLRILWNHSDGLMIQELLDGQEIGADVYIDLLTGKVVSIFTKKKLRMRAGETDKSVSFKDERLFEFIERFVIEAGYRGQIDIDLFDVNGEWYISEVNPRFGGGYPHAYECGCDHMRLIANNLMGHDNDSRIGSYDEDVYMMKWNEVSIVRG